MSVTELLDELSRHQVHVWVDGDRLRYRSPKGKLSPELKGRIKERRQELIRVLASRSEPPPSVPGNGPQTLPSLVPDAANLHRPFPLTDIQQAYLVGRSDDLELGAVSCHGYVEVDARDLDLERLNRAWQRLIDRHDMLRAVVSPDGSQRILEPAEVPPWSLDTVDLRGRGAEEVEGRLAELRDVLSHEVRKSDEWPLFTIRAVQLDDGVTRVFHSFDLLTLDAASIVQIFDEAGDLYEDPERPLDALSISFRDYVLAAEGLERSESYRRARRYWLERIDELPPPPALPLATSPTELAEHRFRRHAAELGREDWERLEARGKELGLTPSGVLLAAFSEALLRFSGEPRMSLNLTFFQKLPLHPQVESLVGDFTSLLLLAVDHQPGVSFAERARMLQARLWEDMDHGEFSGVEVLREMARSQGRGSDDRLSVVFTSLLHQEATARREPMLGWLGEEVHSVTQTPQVLLDHQVYEHDGHLVLNWDVLQGLLPEGLVEEMFTVYQELLERLARHPSSWEEASPARLPASDLAPRRRANATAGELPDTLLHEPFEARAAEAPERPAVITPRRTLSYGELAHRAHLLGADLRHRGAKPGDLVAVVAEKGWEQVVGVLGVLASGAAYLPVAPDLPAERICHLLEVGEVDLAVTTCAVEGSIDWPSHIDRLTVCDEQPTADDPGPLEPQPSAEDLAYVIFTSGSTGRPKGVMIDHRGAANTIFDLNERFRIGPGDRVLAISALNFDLSVYDVFGLLGAGGALVMPDPDGLRDPEHWAELLFDHRVTLWNSVPALVEMLVEHVEQSGESLPGSLRSIWMSGDWIPTSLPDRIRAKGDDIEVLSMGGATEASIWSIYYPIEGVEEEWTSIPYGWPLANQTFHVLDADLEPRPTWVPGELYIGGIGVAKGYWKDPERTAVQFFPHPKTGEPLYRTGDLGRYLPDGSIEFLGRSDFQVKIRGHRIELGEIEAALDEHPAVRRAVVSAVGEPRGERRLVAYVVGELAGSSNGASRSDGAETAKLLEQKLEGRALRPLPEGGGGVELPAADGGLPDPFSRISHRRFRDEPVTLAELGRLLSALRQVKAEGPLGKRLYPSAGHLYPVQVYLHVKAGRVAELEPGFYYHHPAAHQLLPVTPGADLPASSHAAVNRPVAEGAAFTLFLVGYLDAITPVYGEEVGTKLATLEAGYMGQLLMEVAAEGALGLCPIGGMELAPVVEGCELGPRHALLHSLVGGVADPVGRAEWPTAPVATEATADPVAELREFVAAKVPDYMVPSTFVLLDELPLTANGKVDRSRLPEPGSQGGTDQHRFVAPRTPTEEALAAIWKEILGVETVGVHDDFFDSGGDSLKATRVVHRCRDAFDVELPLRVAFAATSIARLAEEIETLGGGDPAPVEESSGPLDLASKVLLDESIRPDPERMPTEAERTAPDSILLTGATGFLGAHLTADLLERTDARLTCLVRAGSAEEGKARVRQALAECGRWEPSHAERLEAVPGDLTRPRLGLSEARFAELAESVEAVIHNGAVISFSRPYEVLEPVNVHGTHEVLRLACAGRVKPVHFVSTINFFFSNPYLGEPVTEDDPCEHPEVLDVGYAQSKWVAEHLVHEAGERGLPVAVYRPGMITGDTRHGLSNEDDFFSRFLKGCIELGAAPDINMTVDMVPVDFVSTAIATLLGRHDTLGEVFHLVNGEPPSAAELMDWVRGFGFPLERLSYQEWRDRLLAVATDEEANALYPLLPIFLDGTTTSELWTSRGGELRFDARRARRALADAPLEWPEGSAELLERYLERFVDSGYLEAPAADARQAGAG